ncbi:hypothetical protein DFJ58DRAFT_146198 [Suillus subalutaceus]|uniref:uncharacterized protein n=1 Tax=Suillus subalutaceus TaxID=48586 RepID=UPI001B861B60|nr:uncharacterized protein DFJ58DRAFT_146198 [Suillus subalutaceus]KAG1837410.1 hypothetical protein DFJ58DRAFT_146198 [Suillus subalutaceus]
MTVVSNDPGWWPIIDGNLICSYFIVAALVGVMYDWALAFGQEIELIWRQRWSFMTFLYLTVRYVGIAYIVMNVLITVPTVSTTDAVSLIVNNTLTWMEQVVNVLLGVIMITRIYAMYQGSRKVLICLVVTFVSIRIADTVMMAIITMQASGEEYVLFGTYQCMVTYMGDVLLLDSTIWGLGILWEVLALYLAVRIAVKHFRELRQHSTGGIMVDCFKVLMQTHVSYFASFLIVPCFQISYLFLSYYADISYMESQVFAGFVQLFESVQIFVLGPRLILGVREYYAEVRVVADDGNTATAMTSIAFHERVHVATSITV